MPSPTFLVVGAARAGTTAIVEGLRTHPDVFITQPKEPHYFAFHDTTVRFQGPGDDQWINSIAITEREDYLRLYSEAERYAVRGDGSVTTLYYSAHAATEIHRINPDMKVVLLLREPVERAFSNFTYMRLRGVEEAPDFVSGLALEDARFEQNWHHMWHYSRLSYYAADVRRLIDVVGRDRVGIWFYDDLNAEYERVLGEVISFLELSPLSRPSSLPRVNASGAPRLELAQRAIRWATNHQLARSTLKHIVPFRVREKIRSGVIRAESVPTSVRELMAPRFQADLADLSTLIAGPVPAWLDLHRR